jgi:hypothetical protein
VTSPPASAFFLPSPPLFCFLFSLCDVARASAPPRRLAAVRARRSHLRRPRVPRPAMRYKRAAAAPRVAPTLAAAGSSPAPHHLCPPEKKEEEEGRRRPGGPPPARRRPRGAGGPLEGARGRREAKDRDAPASSAPRRRPLPRRRPCFLYSAPLHRRLHVGPWPPR